MNTILREVFVNAARDTANASDGTRILVVPFEPFCSNLLW